MLLYEDKQLVPRAPKAHRARVSGQRRHGASCHLSSGPVGGAGPPGQRPGVEVVLPLS